MNIFRILMQKNQCIYTDEDSCVYFYHYHCHLEIHQHIQLKNCVESSDNNNKNKTVLSNEDIKIQSKFYCLLPTEHLTLAQQAKTVDIRSCLQTSDYTKNQKVI